MIGEKGKEVTEMNLLVTGGAGFIGSNFIKYMLEKHSDYKITNLDKLTYCGRLENLKEVEKNPNYKFVKGDIADEKVVNELMSGTDTIINFAAETHVDRSINDPFAFIKTDIFGTGVLLEAARKNDVKKFLQISTDEVYGTIEKGSFKETDKLTARNPYSASKAGAEMLAYSYFTTYGLPVVITRSSNNYGPNQFPEKLIPLFVTNLLQGKKVPVYGDGTNVRDWIYVKDNCAGIDLVAEKGKDGEIYNIGGGNEVQNIDLTNMLLKDLGKGEEMIEYVEDRKGHDKRYSIDSSKLGELGWKPEMNFEQGLKETVNWYRENDWWWEPLVK